jgi:hypothetical protein
MVMAKKAFRVWGLGDIELAFHIILEETNIFENTSSP